MEQKTPFKELTFSQKIQYIWDYYKIPIFLVIIGIIAVTTFIHGRLAQKNTVLSVLCVNAENSTTEDNGADIFNDFLKDISKYLDKAALEKYKDRLAYVTIDGKEYPCGIRLSADDNEFVKASGLYSSCTVGVCCDSSHDAMVKKLCGYILQ